MSSSRFRPQQAADSVLTLLPDAYIEVAELAEMIRKSGLETSTSINSSMKALVAMNLTPQIINCIRTHIFSYTAQCIGALLGAGTDGRPVDFGFGVKRFVNFRVWGESEASLPEQSGCEAHGQ